MRTTVIALGALLATASMAGAQRGTAGGTIDRWINEPKVIALSADQKQKVDSLKAEYVKEANGVTGKAKNATDMQAMVGKMAGLATKYQTAIRSLLTPEQRTEFDKNVAAATMRMP